MVDQSSFPYSIMCTFFTMMYAASAALAFDNSNVLLEEIVADAHDKLLSPASFLEANKAPGYFSGMRFGSVNCT